MGDGIVLGSRAVIPASLRTEVLQGLHAAHQGVAGIKVRARYSVYWPGISAAIVNHPNTCRRCDIIAPSQSSESLCPPLEPEYLFQLVVSDFCEVAGQKFLIYGDRYSAWVSISMSRTEGSGSKFVISELRKWFAIYGVPEEISSDGGPPYTSHEVGAFLSAWGVRHRVSSARYPQSNGRAELSVKTAKRLIYDNTKHGSLDTDSFVRALLQHRNTPLQEIGHSPAEPLHGRPLRDHLPHPVDIANIRPEWLAVASDRELALAKRNIRNVTAFNERNRTKDLPSLCSGDIVAVQNQSGPSPGRWDRTGIVREVRPNRQYIIQMHGSQRLVLRNRVHLRKVTPLLLYCLMPEVPQWRHHRPHEDPAHPRRWTECLFPEATSPAPSTQHLHALVMCLRMELTVLPSPCLTMPLSIQKPWNDNPMETGNYPMIQAEDPQAAEMA